MKLFNYIKTHKVISFFIILIIISIKQNNFLYFYILVFFTLFKNKIEKIISINYILKLQLNNYLDT